MLKFCIRALSIIVDLESQDILIEIHHYLNVIHKNPYHIKTSRYICSPLIERFLIRLISFVEILYMHGKKK